MTNREHERLGLTVKSSEAGHPFYGNQHTAGSGGGGNTPSATHQAIIDHINSRVSNGKPIFTVNTVSQATGIDRDLVARSVQHLSAEGSVLKLPRRHNTHAYDAGQGIR